jgi:hypothetical protein
MRPVVEAVAAVKSQVKTKTRLGHVLPSLFVIRSLSLKNLLDINRSKQGDHRPFDTMYTFLLGLRTTLIPVSG